MAIRTIFFDFGNVIGYFDHGRAVQRLAEYTDLPPVELALAIYGGVLEDDYETGQLSTAEFIAAARANGRLHCTDAEFEEAFIDIFWPNPDIAWLVPRLRPRHRLVLASNTNPMHANFFREMFAGVLEHFDHLVLSYEVKARKPHQAFFAAAQQVAACSIDECLFVDDLPANVEAGRQFGWHGHTYRDLTGLQTTLADLGVPLN